MTGFDCEVHCEELEGDVPQSPSGPCCEDCSNVLESHEVKIGLCIPCQNDALNLLDQEPEPVEDEGPDANDQRFDARRDART